MCYFTSNRLLFDSNFFPILISGGSAITLFKPLHNCTTEAGSCPSGVFFLNRGIHKYKGIENDDSEINGESNSRRTVRLRLMISEAWLPLCFEIGSEVMTITITMTKIVKMMIVRKKIVKMVMVVRNDESNLRRTVRMMTAEAFVF